jgi:hypothetical protein
MATFAKSYSSAKTVTLADGAVTTYFFVRLVRFADGDPQDGCSGRRAPTSVMVGEDSVLPARRQKPRHATPCCTTRPWLHRSLTCTNVVRGRVPRGYVWGPRSLHTAEATGSKPVTPTSANSPPGPPLDPCCQQRPWLSVVTAADRDLGHVITPGLEPLTHDLQAKFVKTAERAQVGAHEGSVRNV